MNDLGPAAQPIVDFFVKPIRTAERYINKIPSPSRSSMQNSTERGMEKRWADRDVQRATATFRRGQTARKAGTRKAKRSTGR